MLDGGVAFLPSRPRHPFQKQCPCSKGVLDSMLLLVIIITPPPSSKYDNNTDLIQQPYGASTRVNFKLQLISIFPSSIFFSSFFECSVRQSEVGFDPFCGVSISKTIDPQTCFDSTTFTFFEQTCIFQSHLVCPLGGGYVLRALSIRGCLGVNYLSRETGGPYGRCG